MRAVAALLLATSAQAGPLDLPKSKYEVKVVETVELPDRTELTLNFPSPLKSPWPPNDVVWAHLVVPRAAGPKAPAVLVLPVMAAPNVWIETRFVNRFVKDGFVVLWLEMPTQFHRRPHPSMPSGQVFLARSAPRLAQNFRQSVLDARRALEVLSKRPEIDADKISLFGISLGALVGSAVYSVDETPKYAAFMMGGAGVADLVLKGSLTGPFARRMGLTPEELEKAFAGLDPLEYKGKLSERPALLVNALSDTVIPKKNGKLLKEAFPNARQIWIPFGHYTAAVHLLWLPKWVSSRLQDALR